MSFVSNAYSIVEDQGAVQLGVRAVGVLSTTVTVRYSILIINVLSFLVLERRKNVVVLKTIVFSSEMRCTLVTR